MAPLYYFNVSLRGLSRDGFGSACVVGMTQVFSAVHPYFRQSPGVFAIDLPGLRAQQASSTRSRGLGDVLRVFSRSREEIDRLAESLSEQDRLRDLCLIGRTQLVDPDRFEGGWITLKRFRVAPRSQPNNRLRDLEAGDRLPFVRTRSKTNGQAYTLTFVREPVKTKTWGVPNSYGLSSGEIVCLPDLA